MPSSPLVAHDDPSVLFTVAGMVPLKPYFLGVRTPPAPRATTCQKCFRTVDIEEVGDATHNTFFEMLGNFSFGDYFKEAAIPYAWELLTGDFGLPAERLWPSTHPGDSAADAIWADTVGVPRDRITHLEDNFWQPGPTGPCGFDSEVYFDRGGPCSCGRADCRPGCEGDRWVEIWNLVFIEFDQDETGVRTPLPRPCIDTGMGLERTAAVLQGVRSIYDTDLFVPLVAGFRSRAADVPPAAAREASLRVLADHLRSTAFLIGDGVAPSNEGRGYVLRRVIRRAALHGRRVGLRGGLAAGVADLLGTMGEAYPELVEHRVLIEGTLAREEEAFERTLVQGVERLDALLADGAGTVRGADAFRLYDTYGFPVELTVELARERGVEVDMVGFEAAMAEQRERSRAHVERVGFATQGTTLGATTFVGYDTLETPATVLRVGESDGDADTGVTAGGTTTAVIEPSPFYAESGGQIGDRGTLTWEGGRATVTDTQLIPGSEVRVLTLTVDEGTLHTHTAVHAAVDAQRRAQTARHHSATHLLHKGLKEVLGEGVVQRGSWVGPEYTTFDFNFNRALTAEEIREVQHRVNEHIRQNLERRIDLLPIAEARASGAVALFGEKYGEQVRVVEFDGWSRELCGGTHVERTGDIGAAIITAESSIGQGTRRIEMVVGDAAERRWTETAAALRETAMALKARPDEVPQRVAALQDQARRLQRDLAEARRAALSGSGGATTGATIEEHGSLRFAHLSLDEAARDAVVAAVDSIYADRLQGDGVVLVVGENALAVKVGGVARGMGVRAGELVRAATAATGGRGGGRDDFASGSVGDPALRGAAVEAVRVALTDDPGSQS